MSTTPETDTQTKTRAPTVEASCFDCDDVHPLEDRRPYDGPCATICPSCGSTSYVSSPIEEISKSDEQRIRDAVDVKGIGEATEQHIVDACRSYGYFTGLTHAELCAIDGVGKTTAERIIENR